MLEYTPNPDLILQISILGVSENSGYLILGAFIIRILLFRLPYEGPLFSETPLWFRVVSPSVAKWSGPWVVCVRIVGLSVCCY